MAFHIDLSINDYEGQMLINRFNYYNSKESGTGLAYYYMRAIVKYLSRLVFAIGWSKLRAQSTTEVNRFLYEKVFRDPTEVNGLDSIEPGAFGHILNECAKMLNLKKLVEDEINILFGFGDARNDQSHYIYRVSFDKYYHEVCEALKRFAKTFSEKKCSYIIPIENHDRSRLKCLEFKLNQDYGNELLLPAANFQWSAKGNRLFYRVIDLKSGSVEFYCLSPFIEIPFFLEDERPHFRVFENVKDHGYGSGFDNCCYTTIVPCRTYENEDRTELIADFETDVREYLTSDLFLFSAEAIKNPDSGWIGSNQNDVFINISSYPGFGSVLDGKYNYCLEICPERSKALAFCRDTVKQVAFVTGNGGMGKTALILSVLKELFTGWAVYGYTNLIFFSAKKRYYALNSDTLTYRLVENSNADIRCFKDFISKLCELLELQNDAADSDTTAKLLIAKINNETLSGRTTKRFLLIVDDLDSMTLEDQKKITDFLRELQPSVMKSIVTTRNIVEESSISYQIRELSEENSVLFAHWYICNIMGINPPNKWTHLQKATELIKKGGQGSPLVIQQLLAWAAQGMESFADTPTTKAEWDKYCYDTVMNMLSVEEKIVFEISRQLYIAMPEEAKEQDLMLAIPEYLAAGLDIPKIAVEKAFNRLQALKLFVISPNGKQFHPYTTSVLNSDVVQPDDRLLPPIYRLFWKDISKNANRWSSAAQIEEVIAEFLCNTENDPLFNTLIARKILERISQYPNLYVNCKNNVQKWLDRHTIIPSERGFGNGNELMRRLIEKIEMDWETLKNALNEGRELPDLMFEIRKNIKSLKNLLIASNDISILSRLKKISEEMNEYDI